MAEEAAITTPEGGNSTNAETQETAFAAPQSQADLDKIIGERLARERAKYADYDEVKKRAAEFDKLAEASKTDQQRLEERATAAEAKVPTLEAENLRFRVAIEKGLPATLIGRLQGSTQEELEADADTLLEQFGGASKVPDLRPAAGQRRVSAENSADDIVRRLAGRG